MEFIAFFDFVVVDDFDDFDDFDDDDCESFEELTKAGGLNLRLREDVVVVVVDVVVVVVVVLVSFSLQLLLEFVLEELSLSDVVFDVIDVDGCLMLTGVLG